MIKKDDLVESFQKNIIIKRHAYERLLERNISITEIEEVFQNDEIIDQYEKISLIQVSYY